MSGQKSPSKNVPRYYDRLAKNDCQILGKGYKGGSAKGPVKGTITNMISRSTSQTNVSTKREEEKDTPLTVSYYPTSLVANQRTQANSRNEQALPQLEKQRKVGL